MTNVDVFVGDRFGEEVASLLEVDHGVKVHPWEQIWAPSSWRRDSIVVPISQVPSEDVERFVNKVCLGTRRPYCAVTLEPRYLRVGPTFSALTDGCFECFWSRQLQHRVLTDTDEHVLEAIRSGNGYVRAAFGYLPAHVRLARDLLSSAVTRITSASESLSVSENPIWPQVFKAGLSHSHLEEFEVVPVHNCKFCAPSSENRSSEATAVFRLSELAERLAV